MVGDDWISSAIKILECQKVAHRKYEMARQRLASACGAMFPGELLVVVGPSRVGKTKCVREALEVPRANKPDAMERMPVVLVEAGNEATSGQFSTKDFAMACLKAIHHPVYGVPSDDDPWETRLNELLDRTPERRLWSSFATALKYRQTQYLVVDEAHHVLYVPKGDVAAARVLDSWKCLGNSTGVRIVLVGSYSLLSLISLAPHLLGRQQPLHFPRYRKDVVSDIQTWEQLLRAYSPLFKFQAGKSLSTWNRLLFEGSLGRLGGLSLWLRTALARMQAEGATHLDGDILKSTRLPALLEAAILEEILQGEQILDHQALVVRTQTHTPKAEAARGKAKRSRPFQKKSRRNPVNGRG